MRQRTVRSRRRPRVWGGAGVASQEAGAEARLVRACPRGAWLEQNRRAWAEAGRRWSPSPPFEENRKKSSRGRGRGFDDVLETFQSQIRPLRDVKASGGKPASGGPGEL